MLLAPYTVHSVLPDPWISWPTQYSRLVKIYIRIYITCHLYETGELAPNTAVFMFVKANFYKSATGK